MDKLDAQKQKRRNNFARWWRKNHARTKAHKWLAHHSRAVIHNYAMPPEQFSEVTVITKRFFNSKHEKMGQSSAWKLFKLTHPLENERIKRIQTTAAYLEVKTAELKEIKKELKYEKAHAG